MKKSVILSLALMIILIFSLNSLADQQAGEEINWQVISSGGNRGTSTSYILCGTAGQTAVGQGSSPGYGLSHGYWQDFEEGSSTCCNGVTGNTDCAGPVEDPEAPDISDIVRLIDFLYLSHDPLCCLEEADVDVSGPSNPMDPFSAVDISDIVYLIDHLYLSHKALPACP